MSTLENTLKQLRLSGLLQTLDVRLQEAVANRLGHAEFLELICQDEINVRQQRMMERRTKAADFRGLKTLEDFDWSFNPAIHRKDIYDLATGNFIRQSKDLLFLGPPGVGKTHLAQAVGYEAIKMNFQVLYRSIFDLVRDFMKDEAFSQQDRTLRRYLHPELLIIDDFGLKQLPKNSGDLSKAEDLFRRSLRLLGRDCLSPEVFETVTRSRADIPIEAGCAWLRAQQPDLTARIWVSWEASIAVQTTWEIFTGYWDDFCYPSSDDVVVWPESENWALLYHHEQEFQLGKTRLV